MAEAVTHVIPFDTEWWPDFLVYRALVDIMGSPEQALSEIQAAVLTMRSMRYPAHGEGLLWNQPVVNTPEFWHGRRYFRLGNGVLGITGPDGQIWSTEWMIDFSSEDVRKHWPALAGMPPPPPTVKEAIRRRLQSGERPGRTVQWKVFCDSIRNDCEWTTKPKRSKRGFGNISIWRAVRDMRRR